jgi:adenylate cyclase
VSPLPDKPSIAVLPFTNISGDPEQEYFADGLTEDLIAALSRFRSVSVIARNSSFHYKGQSPKIQEVGHELGVHYVVEGSVRKAGNRVRITAQLIEAESENHLWAERYDRELEDIFAVQDEVTHTVVSTVVGRIDAAGRRLASRLSTDDLKAYDCFLRGKDALYRFTKTDNLKARELFERAIELDPTYAQAYGMLSWSHLMDRMAHWVEDRNTSLSEAYRSAMRGVELDDADCRTNWLLSEILLFRREHDKARFYIEKALSLNPNDVEAIGIYGVYLTSVGRADEAVSEYEKAQLLDPYDISWLPWLRGIAYFSARRYDEAIAALEQMEDPINEVRGWLAASYAGAGRLDDARAMLEEFLSVAENDMAVFPGRKLAAWEAYWHGAIEYQSEADFEHLFDALRKAGVED